MAKNLYFEISYTTPDGNVHSDSCFAVDAEMKEFCHKLLDEYLRAFEAGHIKDADDSLVFKACSSHAH